LDQRIVRLRLRIDDAARARSARRMERPGFDDLPSPLRYDLYFLRVLVARAQKLLPLEAGRENALPEVMALLDLAHQVGAPDHRWTHVRDVVLEGLELEVKLVTGGLNESELERLKAAHEDSPRLWHEAEEANTVDFASRIREGPP
jgi:hypothetical protein